MALDESFHSHTYAGEVADGKFSHYRIVVGTTHEAIDEYLKLKESLA